MLMLDCPIRTCPSTGEGVWAGRNELVVPSAVVWLGRLGSGGSARQWCRLAEPPGRSDAPPGPSDAHKRRPVATAGVILFKGPQARRYTQNTVPTQGGAHKRRYIATAGVMLFKGPQARRCTQNAVPTQRGAHKRRSVATAGVMFFRGSKKGTLLFKEAHRVGGVSE